MKVVLIDKKKLTGRDILYKFRCEEAFSASPGQFVELRLTQETDPFLRRPFSIFNIDRDILSLLVQTVGRGTELMSKWEPGFETDLIGPLGNGFSIVPSDNNVILAAGGIGIAPLSFLAHTLKSQKIKLSVLFAPERHLELLNAVGMPEGITVTAAKNRSELPDTVRRMLLDGCDRIYSCGPKGFLEVIARAGAEAEVPVQNSLEERMACGFGICLGCAVAINKGNGLVYKRVCHDGPVFSGNEVVWDE